VKMGDMVLVTFGCSDRPIAGVFISDDTDCYGEDQNGDKVLTRAHVMWDGGIYSTPLDQLELINENG